MTYREKIHELIGTINSVYDDAEWLHSKATSSEKRYWNLVRRVFHDADSPLRKLDHHLSNERANHVIIKKTQIFIS